MQETVTPMIVLDRFYFHSGEDCLVVDHHSLTLVTSQDGSFNRAPPALFTATLWYLSWRAYRTETFEAVSRRLDPLEHQQIKFRFWRGKENRSVRCNDFFCNVNVLLWIWGAMTTQVLKAGGWLKIMLLLGCENCHFMGCLKWHKYQPQWSKKYKISFRRCLHFDKLTNHLGFTVGLMTQMPPKKMLKLLKNVEFYNCSY